MKTTLVTVYTLKEDGFEGTTLNSRSDCDNLHEQLTLFKEHLLSQGYAVQDLGASLSVDGSMKWSD